MSVEPRAPRIAARPGYPPPVAEDPRLARFRDDVRVRLGPSCAHLTPGAFEALVRGICETKLRWEPHALDKWSL